MKKIQDVLRMRTDHWVKTGSLVGIAVLGISLSGCDPMGFPTVDTTHSLGSNPPATQQQQLPPNGQSSYGGDLGGSGKYPVSKKVPVKVPEKVPEKIPVNFKGKTSPGKKDWDWIPHGAGGYGQAQQKNFPMGSGYPSSSDDDGSGFPHSHPFPHGYPGSHGGYDDGGDGGHSGYSDPSSQDPSDSMDPSYPSDSSNSSDYSRVRRGSSRNGSNSGRGTLAGDASSTESGSSSRVRASSELAGSQYPQSEEPGQPISESCHSDDPSLICLGLKYVSYVDRDQDAVESEIDAIHDINGVNRIWQDCGIQFQMDQYESVRPQEFQLRYRTRTYDELNQIRGTFSTPGELLVVATGLWNRNGSLGNSYANAWTNLPGDEFYGVVLEQSVSSYPQILAHELGHYLSLEHREDPSALMNPVVHPDSLELSRKECQSARWAARTYWRKMFR